MEMNSFFNQPLINLNRVGGTLSQRFKKLGILSISDLIYYYPFRYEDFSQITSIAALCSSEPVSIKGKIILLNNRRSWRRRMMITEAVISDESGTIKVIWFNQPYIGKILKIGDEIFIAGKVSQEIGGTLFKNPIFEKIKKHQTHTARIIPIYPLVEGLTQKQLRFLMDQAISRISDLPDWLPEPIRSKYNLPSLSWSLKQIHFPDNLASLKQAQKRLGFDELFILQLHNLSIKEAKQNKKAPIIPFFEKPIKALVDSLPYKLTLAQKKAAWQILKDLNSAKPMNRLLEGDVGSGKTVVAAMAMYNTVLAGKQAALMAPTEILAEQHCKTLEKILGTETISLITRSKKKISKDYKIIVGTHALLQKKVIFEDLGLIIIDEQHRFGVDQRHLFTQKNSDNLTPHLLSLTATPIPRTLALTLYGDLDLSIINELPKNRKTIITRVVDDTKRLEAYKFIREKIASGDQIFIVCPLISESDKLGVKSVEQEFERIKTDVFTDLKIAKLHGKLKSLDKEKIMSDFQKKKYDILIATSVIEVGIDIPNATIIVIEGAERFGLAQLHQFRGRVGRGAKQSYCFLFTSAGTPKTLPRLAAFTKSQDGFKLAEFDLKLRGPGDVFGKEQSGFLNYIKLANLNDHALLAQTKEAALSMLPCLHQYPLVEKRLEKFNLDVHWE